MFIRLFQQTHNDSLHYRRVWSGDSDFWYPRLAFDLVEGGVRNLLIMLFADCNGEGNVPALSDHWYRFGIGRSMSVGDVVEINSVLYRIAPVGYEELKFQHMVKLGHNELYAQQEKSSEDSALEALRRKLVAYPVVNDPELARQPVLSKLQQIKELRTIAHRFADNPNNDFARSVMSPVEQNNGVNYFTVTNPVKSLKFWKEMVQELDRAGFTIVRK